MRITLDRGQFIDAISDRLRTATPSAVLKMIAEGFDHYSEAHSGRPDMFPELAGVIAGHLREMSATALDVEGGKKKPRKRT